MQQMLRLRVQRAQELLETTDIPIAHVSDHVGFGSSVGFRQQSSKAAVMVARSAFLHNMGEVFVLSKESRISTFCGRTRPSRLTVIL